MNLGNTFVEMAVASLVSSGELAYGNVITAERMEELFVWDESPLALSVMKLRAAVERLGFIISKRRDVYYVLSSTEMARYVARREALRVRLTERRSGTLALTPRAGMTPEKKAELDGCQTSVALRGLLDQLVPAPRASLGGMASLLVV